MTPACRPAIFSARSARPRSRVAQRVQLPGAPQETRHHPTAIFLAPFIPIALLAQDELALVSLAERLTAPTKTVTDPAGRVTALTSIWKGPGAEPTNDGCVPALPDSLREATVIAYKEAFDEWLDPT